MGVWKAGTSFLLPFGERTLEVAVPSGGEVWVGSPDRAGIAPDPVKEIRRALANPIASVPLRVTARKAAEVVILADDLTRQTPVFMILPEVLDELNRGGVRDEQVTVLIALGTHRPMTPGEIASRFRSEVLDRVPVLNHPWQDASQMADLRQTPGGTPVQVCRRVLEADLVIGVGSIVPHHICGFSGGAKIVQPGVTGASTTGATHLMSTRSDRSLLGQVENPVRAEMETIAAQVGLSAILNSVLDADGGLVRAFFGDPGQAFRAGVGLSREVCGTRLAGRFDVVIAGSHPCDLEFWQAHKSLYPAQMVARPGGTIILVTPCTEGVAVTHQEVIEYAGKSSFGIRNLVEQGMVRDTVAGALALAWAQVREQNPVFVVSEGISPEASRALGFTFFASVDDAVEAAFRIQGPGARMAVLTHAPEMLPLVDP